MRVVCTLLFLLLSVSFIPSGHTVDTTVLSEETEDNEIVLVEDISDDDVDIARSYSKAPSEAIKPKKKPPSKKKPSKRKDKSTPTVATKKSVIDGIVRIEQTVNSLRLATADYGKALHDGDHIDSMGKMRQEALSTISKTWAEATLGAKTDVDTFQPLVDDISKLQQQVNKFKTVIDEQVGMHLELMQSTQDLFPYVDKKSSKALRSYVNQRLKKKKASSRDNLLEMQALQRKVRGSWFLGATTKDLRHMFYTSFLPFALFSALQLVSYHLGWFKFYNPIVHLCGSLVCTLVAYRVIMGPVIPYLGKFNILCQFVAMLAVTAVYAFIHEALYMQVKAGAKKRRGKRLPP